MRAVRCEVCGAKAMIAAAQCPKCGHLFELRDGFGVSLPLAYCSACKSYYPETLGECKWCGTKPERAPIAPQLWRGVGAAVLLVMLGSAWVFRHRPEAYGSLIAARMRATPDSSPRSTSLAADTAMATAITASDAAPSAPTVVPQAMSNADVPVPAAAAAPALRPPAAAGNATAAPNMVPSRSTTAARRAARWTASVSREWVIVRANASMQSRVIASIGPNSHVQLGEARGTWRRIRARGVAGWVEPRTSFDVGRRW